MRLRLSEAFLVVSCCVYFQSLHRLVASGMHRTWSRHHVAAPSSVSRGCARQVDAFFPFVRSNAPLLLRSGHHPVCPDPPPSAAPRITQRLRSRSAKQKISMYVRTYVRMYVCMYVYIYIYIYIYTWPDNVISVVWYAMTWHDMIIWHDATRRYDTMRYDVIWYDMVWRSELIRLCYNAIWCEMICYDAIPCNYI